VVITRADGPIRAIDDLRGKRVAVGASDSPQATLIPLHVIATQGLTPNLDFDVLVFDVLAGKHGDHIGGERDAVRALMNGTADAACILDNNHLVFVQEGTLPAGATQALLQTPPFDHCNFTIMDGGPAAEIARFRELLIGMSYADAAVRRLLDLERLKKWLPGRTAGYALLSAACERECYLDRSVDGILA
jgi:phosphonate transport system substrate-binding protein